MGQVELCILAFEQTLGAGCPRELVGEEGEVETWVRQVSSTENSSQRGSSYVSSEVNIPSNQALSPKGVTAACYTASTTTEDTCDWKTIVWGFLGTREFLVPCLLCVRYCRKKQVIHSLHSSLPSWVGRRHVKEIIETWCSNSNYVCVNLKIF